MTATVLSETKRKLLQEYASGRMTRSAAPLALRPSGMNAELSLAQEQVWRRAAAVKEVPSFYNESITIHRNGPLNLEVLECSFTEVIRRHEIWRTTFHGSSQGPGPVQVVHPAPSRVAIPVIDLCAVEESERWRSATWLATEQAREPFDLEAGPLVRSILIRLKEHVYKLFVTMHQSVVDGVSAHDIFPFELTTLYNAFDEGASSPLPKPSFQFSDFAYNDRQRVGSREWNRQLGYWQRQLNGFTGNRWADAICTATAEGTCGSIQPFKITSDLHCRLQELCFKENVTLFATLLAAVTLLFASGVDDEEIAIGTVTPAGRKRPETQRLLGYFLNAVALRLVLSPQATIRDLLYQCRDVTLEAMEHDDVPFELIDRQLASSLDLRYGCLLPLAVSLAPSVPALPPGWRQTPMDIDTGWARWPLYLELQETSSDILGRAQYSTNCFTSTMINGLLQAFEQMLDFIAGNVSEHISTARRCSPIRCFQQNC